MIKILLVEDNQEKLRLITAVLLSIPGVGSDLLDVAGDVYSAKRRLASQRYDLLILDIALPPRIDRLPEPDAGLDLLTFIKEHPRAIPPAYIVGLTAFSQNAEVASVAFASALWKLIYFSHADRGWEKPIVEAVSYLLQKHAPPYSSDGRTYHLDLGVVAALPEELDAVLKLPADWRSFRVEHDLSSYFRAEFSTQRGKVSVVAVSAQRMGMPSAAVTTANLISTFRPKYLAMVGICAGLRGRVEFGDILVADPCFDWGSGKWIEEHGELLFRPAPYPWRLNPHIVSAVKRVACPELLHRIHSQYQGLKPQLPPRVIVDAMASGGSVLQAQKLVNDVREQHKNLIGIEMESYAFFTAGELAAAPKPTCFSFKSVCDFGDAAKNDEYHRYAAYTSAAFLHAFVENELLPGSEEF